MLDDQVCSLAAKLVIVVARIYLHSERHEVRLENLLAISLRDQVEDIVGRFFLGNLLIGSSRQEAEVAEVVDFLRRHASFLQKCMREDVVIFFSVVG